MKTTTEIRPQKKKKTSAAYIITMVVVILALAVLICGIVLSRIAEQKTLSRELIKISDGKKIPLFENKDQTGYIASDVSQVDVYDKDGNIAGTLTRGARVEYGVNKYGKAETTLASGESVYIDPSDIVKSVDEVIAPHSEFVRTSVNLRDENGTVLAQLASKGEEVNIIGADCFDENGNVHMYKATVNGADGYIMPKYLVMTESEANEVYDENGIFKKHEGRGDPYGGGNAWSLDYYPWEKASFEDNIMPDQCRSLYICSWMVDQADQYIEIAKQCDINTFIVDIADGTAVGYAGDVMKKYSPTSASYAQYTVEEYKAGIQKLKDAGYYVVGRITTFNDTGYVADHPECAILDETGVPKKVNGVYWPTPYNRETWKYKVELALEAVELMGFHEIQFDYVRFPDLTMGYEKNGTIDYVNTYGETKAEAIQRFLMYATDRLHEAGAYISADVFGECAYNYVTAYGQYWPAISTIVDVISGMPYPDHFGYTDTWKPWEHPYDTLYSWGDCVSSRQSECASPAKVRSWIQAYNAIREPYNTYGPEQVKAEIQGLTDAGVNDGYMTWNGSSSLEKYASLIEAFRV